MTDDILQRLRQRYWENSYCWQPSWQRIMAWVVDFALLSIPDVMAGK